MPIETLAKSGFEVKLVGLETTNQTEILFYLFGNGWCIIEGSKRITKEEPITINTMYFDPDKLPKDVIALV